MTPSIVYASNVETRLFFSSHLWTIACSPWEAHLYDRSLFFSSLPDSSRNTSWLAVNRCKENSQASRRVWFRYAASIRRRFLVIFSLFKSREIEDWDKVIPNTVSRRSDISSWYRYRAYSKAYRTTISTSGVAILLLPLLRSVLSTRWRRS